MYRGMLCEKRYLVSVYERNQEGRSNNPSSHFCRVIPPVLLEATHKTWTTGWCCACSLLFNTRIALKQAHLQAAVYTRISTPGQPRKERSWFKDSSHPYYVKGCLAVLAFPYERPALFRSACICCWRGYQAEVTNPSIRLFVPMVTEQLKNPLMINWLCGAPGVPQVNIE